MQAKTVTSIASLTNTRFAAVTGYRLGCKFIDEDKAIIGKSEIVNCVYSLLQYSGTGRSSRN